MLAKLPRMKKRFAHFLHDQANPHDLISANSTD
ncbi:MAG: hypothetical protein ETSY1_39960 [Candidatus Entotheonella factor]|uniref:Uncharacterized protein n=1 Tax=Entotheonella factor TaxID=1429438 RepID=W4L602_ENTF1|nr:MAG: hypothetical protein ETSY1_39960 [Candidatus Entotheonella factor]